MGHNPFPFHGICFAVVLGSGSSFMWPHFVNFLERSWNAMTAAMSTSTFGFIVLTLGFTCITWLATVGGLWLESRKETGNTIGAALRKAKFPILLEAVGVVLLVGILYVCFAIRTIYEDHQLAWLLIQGLRVELDQKQEEHCWMQNISIPPTPPFASANETVVYCNHETKTPFVIVLDYDKELAAGAGFQFGGRRVKSGVEAVIDRKYEAKFESPTLAPYEMFLATVEGKTAIAPTAIKLSLEHVDPDRR
jgi:hypothetical protein